MEENIEFAQSSPNWGAIGTTVGALGVGGILAHLIAKNVIADKEKTANWKRKKTTRKREKKNYGSDLAGYIAYESLVDLLEFESAKFKLGGALGDYLKTVTGTSLRSAKKHHQTTKSVVKAAQRKRTDRIADAKDAVTTAKRQHAAEEYSLKGRKFTHGGEVGAPPPTNNVLKDLWRTLTNRDLGAHKFAKERALQKARSRISGAEKKLTGATAKRERGYSQRAKLLTESRHRRDRQQSAFNRSILATGAVAGTGAGGYAYAKHKEKQKRRNSYYR